ncbi:MAG: DNA polymerase IV [Desulfovibrio sp.]|jgi:DNA polymerase-4|nr:DNA polymerase IV [Desulfovibrio sp.]
MDKSLPRWILHLDMDAFFAAVEQLDRPELRGLPVIIGGAERGVVSTASYEARKFGVRSAMPIFEARRLCPGGVFLPGRMRRYAEKSREIMERLKLYSPLVEPASIDEAYLDATGLERVFSSAENMAKTLQKDILESSGLSCSIGLAPVKFLAKIASDLRKPAGLTILRHEEVPDFLEKLPAGKIPGVGPAMLKKLELMNVRFAGEVRRFPAAFWEKHFGRMGYTLHERAGGVDPRPVQPQSEPKSESAENTFAEDTADPALLSVWLMRQAERVGASLRRQGLSGRTITLKVKYADFTQRTKSRTLDEPVQSTRLIYETALDLLQEFAPLRPLRLIGVGVSKFEAQARQLPLLANPAKRDKERDAALDAALDKLRGRFGDEAVVRGKLFGIRKP